MKGLEFFAEFFFTNLLIRFGVLIFIFRKSGNRFNILIPNKIKKSPARIPARPLSFGVKAIIEPISPKIAPMIVYEIVFLQATTAAAPSGVAVFYTKLQPGRLATHRRVEARREVEASFTY